MLITLIRMSVGREAYNAFICKMNTFFFSSVLNAANYNISDNHFQVYFNKSALSEHGDVVIISRGAQTKLPNNDSTAVSTLTGNKMVLKWRKPSLTPSYESPGSTVGSVRSSSGSVARFGGHSSLCSGIAESTRRRGI